MRCVIHGRIQTGSKVRYIPVSCRHVDTVNIVCKKKKLKKKLYYTLFCGTFHFTVPDVSSLSVPLSSVLSQCAQ